MEAEDRGCGSLHAVYVAARGDDLEGVRQAWTELDEESVRAEEEQVATLEAAVEDGDTVAVEEVSAELLFRDAEDPTLTGIVATVVGRLLYAFGYVASFVLFLGAHSRDAVVARLRWAYRTVGVDIRHIETVDGVERTTFRCPYRNLGADSWGRRRACHDVLDLVDDGYVDWLARHRDLDYQRPQACGASECCYSEVREL